MSNHRFICLMITILALSLILLFTSCGLTSAETKTETETETADHPCYHVTVYSRKLKKWAMQRTASEVHHYGGNL